jgi:proteasome lid subunit RPN8/RPN11
MKDSNFLLIEFEAYRQMMQDMLKSPDQEVCGLLIGEHSRHANVWWPVKNISDEPAKYYQMDAHDQVDGFVYAQQSDCVVNAIVHSHPTTSSKPSKLDMGMAAMTDQLLYVIFSMRDRELSAWTIDPIEMSADSYPLMVTEVICMRPIDISQRPGRLV